METCSAWLTNMLLVVCRSSSCRDAGQDKEEKTQKRKQQRKPNKRKTRIRNNVREQQQKKQQRAKTNKWAAAVLDRGVCGALDTVMLTISKLNY